MLTSQACYRQYKGQCALLDYEFWEKGRDDEAFSFLALGYGIELDMVVYPCKSTTQINITPKGDSCGPVHPLFSGDSEQPPLAYQDH